MYRRVVLVVLSVLCLSFSLSDATLCKPNSKFKVDCNDCTCGSNGRDYSCSDNPCPATNYEDRFYNSITPDGHRLLIPKDNDHFSFHNNDYVLNAKSRKVRVPDGYPYINDEVVKDIQDVDNNKELDVEVMSPHVHGQHAEYSDQNINDDQNTEEHDASNDLDRWARFIRGTVPVYPE